MDREVKLFIEKFVKELEESTAAIFAGAGLSAPAGYVNWKELLSPLADELGLDINKEHDLISLAQYHCNERGGNRHGITQRLLTEFSADMAPTENHEILARLPIFTYWTTNYDQLIESTLKTEGKNPDVKYTVPQLATTKPKRDAIIYKMHGDIDHPSEAVITKDDYEKYDLEKGPFINALAGDLVSKTFLFLGFSFSDPNLDYILGRVRNNFKQDQRQHYCILRKRSKFADEEEDVFRYEAKRQNLAINDLKRFNIKTLLVDDYANITEILRYVERLYNRQTIFISGSAHEYGKWTREATEEFIFVLSKVLIQENFKIATGVGLGVGNAVLSGALDGVYRYKGGNIEDNLIIRPFPLMEQDEAKREQIWEIYRQDIIRRAGIALFLLGNKLENGKVISADGIRKEFNIAKELGLVLVPIGATEYVSRELWQEMSEEFHEYFPGASDQMRDAFERLGVETDKPLSLVESILNILQEIRKE